MLKESAEIIKEKKVEYIELIYDLIFVYIIGRNSSLLHNIQDGFVPASSFMTYVLGTLIIIQIWNFTNFYINRYGSNGKQEHMLILINMFLLYFMGDATRTDWQDAYYYKYNIAWALILINFIIHYWMKYQKYKDYRPWESIQILYSMVMMGIQTVIIVVSLPLYYYTGVMIAPLAMVFGIIFTICTSKVNMLVPVDFGHLTERAMLYIVFTFGEMIIAISSYFEGEVSLNNIYFALMGFLIVVGLFQSYELCYDFLIDREMITNGTGYMMIHIFLIFALNNITAALEFMREPEVDLLVKTIFITVSFVVYYIFMFVLGRYMKIKMRPSPRFLMKIAGILIAFSVMMILFRENMYINIAVSVALVYSILAILMRAKNLTTGCNER